MNKTEPVFDEELNENSETIKRANLQIKRKKSISEVPLVDPDATGFIRGIQKLLFKNFHF